MARTKGSKNRNKHGLAARLRVEFGKDFDVVMNAAAIVTNEKSELSDKERFDCYMKIAPYIHPMKKAVEMRSEVDTTVEVKWESR